MSYGVLNLTHRDGHEVPEPVVPGQVMRVRLQLNDAGFRFPAGHRIRVALSTTYWPMIWPGPDVATVTLFAGSGVLLLPERAGAEGGGAEGGGAEGATPVLPDAVTAAPARSSVLQRGPIEPHGGAG